MSDNQPKLHPELCIEPDKNGNLCIEIKNTYDLQGNVCFTPDEAISIGLSLMETGLYLKDNQKKN